MRKIIWLLVNNIQVTISVTLQYFRCQMEATSYVNFIGWKFDMWIQAWKLIHSLQVMLVTVKSSLYSQLNWRVWPQSKAKIPAVMMRLSCEMFFDWSRNSVKLCARNYWTWHKLLWPKYRETKLKSTKERNFIALKDIFITSPGCCLAY